MEVETEGRETKVEPPGSPTPYFYSPPELFTPEKLRFSGGIKLAVDWARQNDGDIYPVSGIFYQ
jgi:hypothetical protein